MTKTWCVGGSHYSDNNNNKIENEKVNPKTKKIVKIIKVLVVLAIVLNHNFSLSKILKEEILLKIQNVNIASDSLCQIQHGVI